MSKLEIFLWTFEIVGTLLCVLAVAQVIKTILKETQKKWVPAKYGTTQEKKVIKFGFDIHGVCDALPEVFGPLTTLLVEAGHEVHILTGSMWTDKIDEELRGYGVRYTHKFSISDYRIAQGHEVTFDEKGTPWMTGELWDSAKGEYCMEQGINLHLDDTLKYNDYFKTPFVRVWTHNGNHKGAHRDPRHMA